MSRNSKGDFRWVWLDLVDADVTVSRNAHHAAYVLARKYVNTKTLQAYPSHAELAQTMHCSKRLAGDVLRELVAKGYLDVRHGYPARPRGHVYSLRAPDLKVAGAATLPEASRC